MKVVGVFSNKYIAKKCGCIFVLAEWFASIFRFFKESAAGFPYNILQFTKRLIRVFVSPPFMLAVLYAKSSFAASERASHLVELPSSRF